MASRPPPSFFSLMLNTSATTLKISTEFVTKHLKNKIPKGPIIICAKGGYSWRIKIRKIEGNYYFDNGWTNVVKDVNFMFGDFVLFRLVGKYTFKMSVYGKYSCERSLPKKVKVGDDGSRNVDNVAANVDIVNDDEDDDDDDVDDKEEEDDDDDEEEDVDIDGDDGDPFFISTISKANKMNLRLPDEFVELAGIEDERSIMLKNLDGQEWQMELRPEKVNQLENLYVSSGWADFQESNDLREGDECVLKFISSEGKILLAKVTKKKRPTRQSQPSSESSKTEVVKRKRGWELHSHGKDVDVESEDEYVKMAGRLCGNDDDDKYDDSDEDEDVEGDNDDDYDGNEGEEDEEEEDGVDIDGHPFFKFTILKSYKSILRFPANFVRSARIEAARFITLKNLDGEESSMRLRLEKSSQLRYYISSGWPLFRWRNKLLEGDKCVFKYITSEGKICVAKVTKKQRPAWQPQPSTAIAGNRYVKRKRGHLPRGEDNDKDNYINVDDDDNHNDNAGKDEDGGDGDSDGDPFFTPIISRFKYLRLPKEFVGLPGLHAGGTILLKDLKGKEWRIGVKLDKSYRQSERYLLQSGWVRFVRSNDMSVGDKCILKFIRKEGKFCIEKVTKKQRPSWKPQPSGEILATEDTIRCVCKW